MTRCLGPEVMNRFVAGTASRSEGREIVRHLLAGCAPCAISLRPALRRASEPETCDDALALPAQAGCS
ncbi:MAG TPA: hypothetical protein VEW48_02895 [Thermoanaerobaculia bacterium]|nr:hypothetical protein [Thermoanaerobaculia bacterium]